MLMDWYREIVQNIINTFDNKKNLVNSSLRKKKKNCLFKKKVHPSSQSPKYT